MKTYLYVVNKETGSIKVTSPDGKSGSLLFDTTIHAAKAEFARCGIALRSLGWFKSKKIWFNPLCADVI